MPALRVVIAGGSLGGLTALALRDSGCDVEMFERSRVPLHSRGAGIVLHSETVRDVAVPRMAFGRVAVMGDAAFAARPHAAAGTAKAAADAWALAAAVAATGGDVPTALARWEPGRSPWAVS